MLGQPHYGHKLVKVDDRYTEVPDPQRPARPVLDALREAGSVAGAVRLLNEAGVPSPRGKVWHTSAFRRVVDHEAPGLLTSTSREHPRTHRPAVLAGLLRCHCGATMTPNPAKGQYYCHKARITSGHGKATVTERLILPWVKGEAAHHEPPELVDIGGTDATGERSTLEAQRERLRTQHRLGVITDDELASGWADVRGALDRLDAREAVNVLELPDVIDWDHDPPDAINVVLRSLWRHVQLGPDLMPIDADWRVPQWRNPNPR